ncbi:hypothetical protein [Maridesulfovibrio zosterae]|uniref:hypothetical protein n=1 Tax=Maridesulfovibrio zosterae TaxID=82171 RepID=UPI0003FB7A08|nr:hypothetical protein [Maridesulfovibrio zosterae]
MWKSVIIITNLVIALTVANTYAAGLNINLKEDSRERAEENLTKETRTSFEDMMTGLYEDENIKAGFVFGLNNASNYSDDGPTDNSSRLGLGIGFGFSF